MYYVPPSQMLMKYYRKKREIQEANNKRVAVKVQTYNNQLINDFIINKRYEDPDYNLSGVQTTLQQLNKAKTDNEYRKLITDKNTSNTLYHQVNVQRTSNLKALQITTAQYNRIQSNILSVERVLRDYEVNINKYKELNKKYPITQSRKGIVTESINIKNIISSHGINIRPHVDGYRELDRLTESMHRRVQIEADRDLRLAENEEAIRNGNEAPYKYKTWVWTGVGKTTRHRSNNGKTVPIDKYFIIENDIDGTIDEMMYPLDPTCHSSNGFICYCEVDYHNNPDGLGGISSGVSALDTALASINNRLSNIERIPINTVLPKKQKSKFSNLFSLNRNPIQNKLKNKKDLSKEKTISKDAQELFRNVGIHENWIQDLSPSLKRLKSQFKGVVKIKYLDEVFSHFEYFKRSLNAKGVDRNIEHCTIRRMDGTIVEFYNNNKYKEVIIPKDIQKEGIKNYIHTTIHSHPKGTPPISSSEDIRKYVECGVINGISMNELGTMIITNNNIYDNKQNIKVIAKKVNSIRQNMIEDFCKDMNNNLPINWKDSNDIRRLNKYVDKYSMRYVSKYKKVLKPYNIKVKFIK